MNNYSIGEKIKEFRSSLKISQEQLALRANITPAYLGQIERGEKNPTINVIQKITDILGVSLSEFFHEPCENHILSEPSKFYFDVDIYSQQVIFEMRVLSDNDKKILLKLIKNIIKFKFTN